MLDMNGEGERWITLYVIEQFCISNLAVNVQQGLKLCCYTTLTNSLKKFFLLLCILTLASEKY